MKVKFFILMILVMFLPLLTWGQDRPDNYLATLKTFVTDGVPLGIGHPFHELSSAVNIHTGTRYYWDGVVWSVQMINASQIIGLGGAEADPIFSASPSFGIAAPDIVNWDNSFSWGDHSLAGYLTSYTETDPIYSASSWFTTTNNSTNWNTAYGWGDHGAAGYVDGSGAASRVAYWSDANTLTSDADFTWSGTVLTLANATDQRLVLKATDAGSIGGTPEGGWNYMGFYDGQGDRQGYFGINTVGSFVFQPEVAGAGVGVYGPTVIYGDLNADELELDVITEDATETTMLVDRTGGIVGYREMATEFSNWNTAYGWGDHSTQGYLTSYSETDPIYSAWDKDYNDLINTPTVASLNYWTQNGTDLYYTTGLVGIGTASPDWMLDIVGPTALAKIERQNSDNANRAPAFLYKRTRAGGSDILSNDWLGKLQFYGQVGGGDQAYGGLGYIASNLSGDGRLFMFDDLGNEMITFYTNGDMDVTGDADVTGDLTASNCDCLLDWANVTSKPTIGDVTKTGTAADGRIAVWTSDGAIEGTTSLTYDAGVLNLTGNITLSGTVDGIDIATDVAANTAKVTNATHSGDVSGSTTLTIGANKVNDTHIDWGTGTNQVSTDDITEGSTNLFDDSRGVTGAYGAGWNGSADEPTKDAVYDEMELKATLLKDVYTVTTLSKTLTEPSGSVIVNIGAINNTTWTLPASPSIGTEYTFGSWVAGRYLRIACNTADRIYGANGALATSYVTSPSSVGNTITMVLVASKTWLVVSMTGTWTFT